MVSAYDCDSAAKACHAVSCIDSMVERSLLVYPFIVGTCWYTPHSAKDSDTVRESFDTQYLSFPPNQTS